ncbi:hypothetical protein CMO92_01475 [Candidatus Woesearchaeota archaeon]|nr:hypothetical protein [Candidatus Woesearchaeota archaeon]
MGDRLLMFTGTECGHCHEMEPVVAELEKSLNVKVVRLEVWHDEENNALREKLDGGKCGGVPFFFNEKTEKSICGEASLDQMKEWASGE